MRALITIIAVFSFAAVGSTRAASRMFREEGIRIACESEDALANWHRYVTLCLMEAQDVLGHKLETSPTLRITFGEEADDGESLLDLSFHPGQNMLEVTDHLVRSLILRDFVSKDEKNAPVLESLPWVAAAVTNRILYSNREQVRQHRPDYQPARFLFAQGKYPDVIRLIEVPVTVNNPVPYRLYAVHCDLFALCLQELAGEDMIWKLLTYESHGRPAVEALTFLLQGVFKRGDNLQSWYERHASDLSRRGRRISDAETIAQRLEDLLTVPIVAPGQNDFRGQRMPIEDVPERLDVFKVDARAMGRLQKDLYELLKDAPELLRPPLIGYIEACGTLGEGKTRKAVRQFRENRRLFAEALRRQRSIESYLDELERDYVPTERRLGIYLDVVRRHNQAERRLDPQLHDYLDSFQD